MPIIQSLRITPVSFKFHRPFVTAKGMKTQTHNLQVTLQLSNGKTGVGEASTSIAMPGESPENMERAIKDLISEVRERPIDDYRAIIQACWRKQPYHPTAVAAVECALLDAYTQVKGKALYQFLGGKKTSVESDLTLSVGTPAALFKTTQAALKKGFRRFKIKLAGDSARQDVERVLAVRRAAPRAALVADGNQGLNASQALDIVHRLARAQVSLTFFEQPFPKHDLPLMRSFRKKSRVPLMVDESVLTPADAIRVFEQEAADGIVIKVAKSGLLGALDILQVIRRFQKKAVIGCMEESKIGLAPSVHLACGTGAFEWVDLDSVFLLKDPGRRGGFRINGARLSVANIRSGIGV